MNEGTQQRGALPLELIAVMTLMLVGIFVGIAIMQSIGESRTGVDDPVARAVEHADYPICGDYNEWDRILESDFKTIVYARHLEKCNSAYNAVRLRFTLTNETLAEFARNFRMVGSGGDPRILYRPDCTVPGSGRDTGFDGIVVGGERERVLYQKGEELVISQVGGTVALCNSTAQSINATPDTPDDTPDSDPGDTPGDTPDDPNNGTDDTPDNGTDDGPDPVNTFNIVYVPLNYDSGEYDAFRQEAESIHNYYVSESPFNTCQTPEEHIQAFYVEDMTASCENDPPASSPNAPTEDIPICSSCHDEARDRVRASDYSDTFDLIQAVCKGDSCPGIDPQMGTICGCADGIPGTVSATLTIDCDGTAPSRVGTHELGHTNGLYHMECGGGAGACQGPNAADCGEPDEQNYIMGYCQQEYFGDAAYTHLESDQVFGSYLEGCGQ